MVRCRKIVRFRPADDRKLLSRGDRCADLGRIDVLVSNSGYGLSGAAKEPSDAQIEHQIATNLTGSIASIRAVLPYMRERGGGRILQVSSEGGQIAYTCFSLSHATKLGIEGFVESVAQEVAPLGIGMTPVEPGPAGTGSAGSLVRPDRMADAMIVSARSCRISDP